jgi:thioredoxin-like negative regulator of GroEL
MRKLIFILALAVGLLSGCEGDSSPQPVAPSRQVLAFTATWCGPCRQNKPILADMERQGAPIVHIDIDANPALADRHGIVSVPTYVVLENGREIERTQDIRRLLKLLRLLRWLRQH